MTAIDPAAKSDPYAAWLLQQGKRLSQLTPDGMEGATRPALYAHWKAANEWRNAEMANVLLILCHLGSIQGMNGPAGLAGNIEAFFRRLEQRGHGGRWYHLEPGMGDRNLDRFTLLPLMEAFFLAGHSLESSLQDAVLGRIREALDVQFVEYGKEGRAFGRIYPNMDVYYCLIMLLGWRLLGEARHQQEFERALKHLAAGQFEDGAWTYIKGMNESPGYHALVAVLMGRIADLSGHEEAMSQLDKSIAYYPKTATRSGIMESHTDCWWKHQWGPLTSIAPDVVGSITGDGQNRWLGDQVREATLEKFDLLLSFSTAKICNFQGLFLFYGSRLWRDVKPEPLPETLLLYDANIQGPRGHMKGWSWAASGRFGGDTVVGATAHTSPSDPVHALMAVTPEIPYFPPGMERGRHANDCWNLAMFPEGNRGTTRIENGRAFFEINYSLAGCRAAFGAPPFPLDWQCEQRWEMGPEALKGCVKMTSSREQWSALPVIRIRFGEGHFLRKLAPAAYAYGRFKIVVEPGDFPGSLVREAPVMVSYVENDADELVYFVNPDIEKPVLCAENQTFFLQMSILFQDAG